METDPKSQLEDSPDLFGRDLDRELLRSVCRGHADVMPVLDYGRFDRAVWNAIEAVMGDKQSAMLRTVAGSGAGPAIRLPGAIGLAALRWLHENMPRTATKVLAQSREYYSAR